MCPCWDADGLGGKLCNDDRNKGKSHEKHKGERHEDHNNKGENNEGDKRENRSGKMKEPEKSYDEYLHEKIQEKFLFFRNIK